MPKKATIAERTRTVASKGGRKVARSSDSGEIVSPARAKADPKGTIVQAVERPLDEFLRKFKEPTKIPKSIGTVADLLYSTREDRLRLAKAVSAMEDFEKALKDHIIETVPKSDATGAAGKRARVQVIVEPQAIVEDWEQTYAHIKKTGQFDLLNRALNRAAVKARWEAGKTVPGVGTFNVTKVSVTKL